MDQWLPGWRERLVESTRWAYVSPLRRNRTSDNWDCFQPTEVRYGNGRASEVGEAVARFGKRCLLMTVPPESAPVFPALFNRFRQTNSTGASVSVNSFLSKCHVASTIISRVAAWGLVGLDLDTLSYPYVEVR